MKVVRKRIIPVVLAVLVSLSSFADGYTKEVVELWDRQNIPFNREDITLVESVDSTGRRISQISIPKLYVYRKKDAKQNGSTLMYIPGGGYRVVSLKNDGEITAQHFLNMGFDVVAILKYRLPDEQIVSEQYKVPLCDAQKALAILHRNSKKWQLDRNKIAVMGSSAGGHLAASLANLTNDVIAPGVKSKELTQAVSILLYPVISFNLPYRHGGSFKYLLGEKQNDEALLDYYSMENQVNENTPTTFLIHALDDASVPYQNSEIYIKALKEKNILHGYLPLEKGGHGFGLNFSKTDGDWTQSLEKWLRENTRLFSPKN